jgi:hypothetical protein
MVSITRSFMPDEFTQHESSYQTQYGVWNGLVSRNPTLRQIIEIRGASVFSSWAVKGAHMKEAQKMLDELEGRNGETFKQIAANMYKIAYICGDAYAEIIWDEKGPEEGIIERLEILPSDNIRQIIERGTIKEFEEISTSTKWKPQKIFHVRYNPRGAMTHGIGMVESMNNLLVSREQLAQVGQEIYEKMSRPKQMILAKTDNAEKLNILATMIQKAGDEWHGIAILPAALIDDTKEITLNPSLKPQEYLDFLDKEMFKSTATPEIVLGTGYSTSEEDAKTRIAGFMGSIRYDQEDIEFSFAQEAYDAMYNRIQSSLPVIESLVSVAPENKESIIKEKLKEMGMIT